MLLALALPHSGFLLFGLIFLVLGAGLFGLGRFWPASAAPVVTEVGPVKTRRIETVPLANVTPAAGAATVPTGTDPTPVAAPARDQTGPVVAFARAIAWPALVDPDADRLSEEERLHVIEGLAIAGDAWCASVLLRAYAEEADELRVAAIEALAACEGDLVGPALERAYGSYVIAERYAAVDGASRRAEIGLLERALRDTDGTVALAAAYGLHRARRDDLVDAALADRDDPRASEIRRLLPILA